MAIDPMAQRAERRRITTGLTKVTVELNESQVEAIDRFIAADTGGPKALTRAMVLHRAVNDYLRLNERTLFLGVGRGTSGKIDGWE